MGVDRHNLSLAVEYAVASELCKRNIYAQITLVNLKCTDLLCASEQGLLRIQVKGKQGRVWPGVKEVYGNDMVLVLVDFEKKNNNQRPDFYILNSKDFRKFLLNNYAEIDEKNTITWVYEKKLYKGLVIKSNEITNYKEKWNKIEDKIKLP
jgi:hypothetical protein